MGNTVLYPVLAISFYTLTEYALEIYSLAVGESQFCVLMAFADSS